MGFETKVQKERVISNTIRFGYGYRYISRQDKLTKQYFAWFGEPDRNSNYVTYCEITQDEYYKIERKYPNQIEATIEEGDYFRDKYIKNHKIIIRGWDVSL